MECTKRYLENARLSLELQNRKIITSNDEKQILSDINDIKKSENDLFLKSEELLKQIRSKLNNHMSPQEYEDLFSFALQLSENFAHVDLGLALEVHTALLNYALFINDPNLIIKEAYYKGMSYYYLDSRLFVEQYLKVFLLSVEYMPQYTKLSKDGRLFFNKCYGNILISYTNRSEKYYKKAFEFVEHLIDFWNKKEVRDLDPDFHFNNFIFSVKRTTTSMIDLIRRDIITEEKYIEQLYQYSKDCYEHGMEEVNNTIIPLKGAFLYNYYAMCFHTNRMELDELLSRVLHLANDNDSAIDFDSINRKVHLNGIYLHYLSHYSTLSKPEIIRIANKNKKSVMEFVKTIKSDVYNHYISQLITQYMLVYTEIVDDKSKYSYIFELSIVENINFFMHSYMVAMISTKILKHVLEKNPKYLLGIIDNYSLNDIEKNKNKIIYLNKIGCLLHDIGKSNYINTCYNFNRDLTLEERLLIRNHCERGYKLLSSINSEPLYVDMAKFHHKHYDTVGGYPEYEYKCQNKPLIDILAVADFIEQAEDIYCCSLMKYKSFKTVIDELKDGSNTRFNKEIVDIVVNDLHDKLFDFLVNKRKNIFIKVCKISKKVGGG